MSPRPLFRSALSSTAISAIGRQLASVVEVKPREIGVMLLAFAHFFSILCAYYIIRPVRDEMGVAVGPAGLQWLFSIVLLVMLVAVPVFGWVATRLPRRLIVPSVYAFFVIDLIAFWALLRATGPVAMTGGHGAAGALLAGTFFVWTSVFNLFVVSLFWSLMADLFRAEQAKRLYGFIAAGGSVGALTGPVLTQSLLGVVGPDDLLLLSAMFLIVATSASLAMRRLSAAGDGSDRAAGAAETSGQGLLMGAVRVWQSPLLFRIAVWVLLANLVSTLFYLEQSRIIGATLADRTARVLLLSRIDLAVNVMTLAAQLLLTARVLQRLGEAFGAALLPAWAVIGLVALTISPTLAVIATIMAIERVIAFSLASPAVKVFYTNVPLQDKYQGQNFIDTAIYRGGDAMSGWLFNGLSTGLGLGAAALAGVALPLGLVWFGFSMMLGWEQSRKKDETTPADQRGGNRATLP